MRLTRIYLRNYRVYESELDLEIPPGLVGIYGANGAGKSTLVESIGWTLFGKARTNKDDIRTAGITGDCVSEVEFEHEGHLYLVRRTLSGLNNAVKAEAYTDGALMSGGVTDTARYVHSTLGMDYESFRSSVFAEQRQMSAFSDKAPAERRKLVLGLLGVTPLESAREQARKDARDARHVLEQMRSVPLELDVLIDAVSSAEASAEERRKEAEAEEEAQKQASSSLDRAESHYDEMHKLATKHSALVAEGKGKAELLAQTKKRVEKLEAEQLALAKAQERLDLLAPLAAGLLVAEQQLRLGQEVVRAAKVLADLGQLGPTPPEPDFEQSEAARKRGEEARQQRAADQARLEAARSEAKRAEEAVTLAASLSEGEDCPLCGQALGGAFDRVQHHRREEAQAASARCAELAAAVKALNAAVAQAEQAEKQADQQVQKAREAYDQYQLAAQAAKAAQSQLEQAKASAIAGGLDDADIGPKGVEHIAGRVEKQRAADRESQQILGQLSQRTERASELSGEREKQRSLDQQIEDLRHAVRDLGFRGEDVEAAERALGLARQAADNVSRASREAAARAAAADERVRGAKDMLEAARKQHDEVDKQEDRARHLGRVAELLDGFRNAIVAIIGPRLSAQAADLFGELTDHEYDRLEVDPESYEIQIRDQGVAYGMDRFSGSETDLANLALRVAISEQVGFQSGGAVGLLVLDEVFGPLDEDRKARMLTALERLKGRFRQVLVVTHSDDIKDQLPGAIEVIKQPGRRATAQVL